MLGRRQPPPRRKPTPHNSGDNTEDESASASELYLRAASRRKHATLLQLAPATVAALCGYDPALPTLHARLEAVPMIERTQCPFARRAVLWSMQDWAEQLSLEENLALSLRAFVLFSAMEKGVDGFLFMIPSIGVPRTQGSSDQREEGCVAATDAEIEAETEIAHHAHIVKSLLHYLK